MKAGMKQKVEQQKTKNSLGNVDKQAKLGFWRWANKQFLTTSRSVDNT